MHATKYETRPPPFEAAIELETHVAALPPGGTVKGMFLRDALSCVAELRPDADVFALAGIERRRVLPFFDYPYQDHMRIVHAAAQVCWPEVPIGEGLRRIGWRAYDVLLGQQIGRVIFAAFGRDFGRVSAVGVKGWKIGVGFGAVRHESLGERHAAYHFTGCPPSSRPTRSAWSRARCASAGSRARSGRDSRASPTVPWRCGGSDDDRRSEPSTVLRAEAPAAVSFSCAGTRRGVRPAPRPTRRDVSPGAPGSPCSPRAPACRRGPSSAR